MKLDSYEVLSEQDYGPWLDKVTVYQESGKFLLEETSGYHKPYNKVLYELFTKPEKPLAVLFDGFTGFCGSGDQKVLEDVVGPLKLLERSFGG